MSETLDILDGVLEEAERTLEQDLEQELDDLHTTRL